jgi:MYXO-CTERM domain-containing protein
MTRRATNIARGLALITLGLALAAAGIHVGETDDAPGAALIGILLMLGLAGLGLRIARRRT